MQTEDLITALAGDLQPVRRLPSPAGLLARWLAVTLPALALITLIMGPRPDLGAILAGPGFLAAEALGALTALLAAHAAFCAGRPDQPGWKPALPALALLLWLGELGRQCAVLGLRGADGALRLHLDLVCVPAIAIASLVPAAAMVALLRGSAAFRRGPAGLCGALAACAAAEVALRLFHGSVNLVTLLAWQMGSMLALALIGGLVSSRLLRALSTPARRPRAAL